MTPNQIHDLIQNRSLSDIKNLLDQAEAFYEKGHVPTEYTDLGKLVIETQGMIDRRAIQVTSTAVYMVAHSKRGQI